MKFREFGSPKMAKDYGIMGKLIAGGPYSKPAKLERYPGTKPSKPVNPQEGGLSSKLPKK